MSKRSQRGAGFTLVELLVTMAIIGLLIALLLPAVQSVRESARKSQCQNQLRQLGLALHNYHDHHLTFPPGSWMEGPNRRILSGWGWGAMILPHIDQGPLYQRIDFNLGTAVGGNLPLIGARVSMWQCPSEISADRLHVNSGYHPPYDVVSGNYCGSSGILDYMSSVRMAGITDGTSQTLMLGERIVQSGSNGGLVFTSAWIGQVAFQDEYEYRCVPTLLPDSLFPINDSVIDPKCFGSRHPGGAYFVFCDGSTRFLNQNISGLVFEALGTPSGGEVISLQ